MNIPSAAELIWAADFERIRVQRGDGTHTFIKRAKGIRCPVEFETRTDKDSLVISRELVREDAIDALVQLAVLHERKVNAESLAAKEATVKMLVEALKKIEAVGWYSAESAHGMRQIAKQALSTLSQSGEPKEDE